MKNNILVITMLCSLTGCGIFAGGTTKVTTQCTYPNIPASLLSKRQPFPSIESYLAGESLINTTLQESH